MDCGDYQNTGTVTAISTDLSCIEIGLKAAQTCAPRSWMKHKDRAIHRLESVWDLQTFSSSKTNRQEGPDLLRWSRLKPKMCGVKDNSHPCFSRIPFPQLVNNQRDKSLRVLQVPFFQHKPPLLPQLNRRGDEAGHASDEEPSELKLHNLSCERHVTVLWSSHKKGGDFASFRER